MNFGPVRMMLWAAVVLTVLTDTNAFATTATFGSSTVRSVAAVPSSTTSLSMANNDDYMRWARQSRSASAADNVVELLRPLGLVLNEDEQGNVYVETVAPKGNAARTGKVRTRIVWNN